jgi:hypothetical protein
MQKRNFLREIAGATSFGVVFDWQIFFVSCFFSHTLTSAEVVP